MSIIEVLVCVALLGLVMIGVVAALRVGSRSILDVDFEREVYTLAKNNAAMAAEISKTPLQNEGWTLNRDGDYAPLKNLKDNLHTTLIEYRTGSKQYSYIAITRQDSLVGNAFTNAVVTGTVFSPGTKLISYSGNVHIYTSNNTFAPTIPAEQENSLFMMVDSVELVQPVGDFF
jgi:hypothetical protein